MESVVDELARVIREEAALKLLLDDAPSADDRKDVEAVLLAVTARIVYLRNRLTLLHENVA